MDRRTTTMTIARSLIKYGRLKILGYIFSLFYVWLISVGFFRSILRGILNMPRFFCMFLWPISRSTNIVAKTAQGILLSHHGIVPPLRPADADVFFSTGVWFTSLLSRSIVRSLPLLFGGSLACLLPITCVALPSRCLRNAFHSSATLRHCSLNVALIFPFVFLTYLFNHRYVVIKNVRNWF